MASETTVNESETTVGDVDATDRERGNTSSSTDAFTAWFASSALRVALVFLGVVVLLAAVGQLSGIDLLGYVGEFLGSETGQWLVVAVLAIGLIAVAVYGFTGRSD